MAALIEVENLVKHYQLGEVTVEALGGLIGIALGLAVSVLLSCLAKWATLISGGGDPPRLRRFWLCRGLLRLLPRPQGGLPESDRGAAL